MRSVDLLIIIIAVCLFCIAIVPSWGASNTPDTVEIIECVVVDSTHEICDTKEKVKIICNVSTVPYYCEIVDGYTL